MSAINFSITIHLQPKLKTSYLLSAFVDNELLPTKTFTVAGSLIMKKILYQLINFTNQLKPQDRKKVSLIRNT